MTTEEQTEHELRAMKAGTEALAEVYERVPTILITVELEIGKSNAWMLSI